VPDSSAAQRVWKEFTDKLKGATLRQDDFAPEMRAFLYPLLCGEGSRTRRDKFAAAPAEYYCGETRESVLLHCADDEYRFDFALLEDKWVLCFIECITLPVSAIPAVPYETFPPLSDKEAWIRAEKAISRDVYLYCKLKRLLGAEEALNWFNDGAGEFMGAKSWVPFFEERKAFIVYSAWMENRIYGESVVIDVFSADRCVLRLRQHLWFRLYRSALHLAQQISLEEFRALFEHIWKDRAKHSGWEIEFTYDGEDTIMTFTIAPSLP